MASRCPQKWWKTLFLKVLFYVFFWKMRKNKHIFAKLTFKIVHFIRFVWRALSSGALSYPDISGNIRVKSQFENVTSRQFSMKISILQGLNKASWAVRRGHFWGAFLMSSSECVNLANCWGSGADRSRGCFFSFRPVLFCVFPFFYVFALCFQLRP